MIEAAWDEALTAADPQRRFDAIAQLVENDVPDAQRRILPLLADPFAPVRAQAACALGDLGDRAVADRLAALLGDEPEVVFEAALALARLADTRGVDVLVGALFDGRSMDAVTALGQVDLRGHPIAADALKQLARRWFGQPLAKLRAAVILAKSGHPEGRALVARLARSWRKEIRAQAQIELAELDLRAAP